MHKIARMKMAVDGIEYPTPDVYLDLRFHGLNLGSIVNSCLNTKFCSLISQFLFMFFDRSAFIQHKAPNLGHTEIVAQFLFQICHQFPAEVKNIIQMGNIPDHGLLVSAPVKSK